MILVGHQQGNLSAEQAPIESVEIPGGANGNEKSP
jgi:hypothetical protein